MTRMEAMEAMAKPIGMFIAFSFLLHPYTYTPKVMNGKLILLTDVGSPVGEAIAYQYCKVKTRILLSARDSEVLTRVAEKCRELGTLQVETLAGDIDSGKFREKLIKEADVRLGGLDHLMLSHHFEVQPARWLESFKNNTALDADFTSYVDLASRALPLLEKTGGKIGVVSSLVGIIPVPSMSHNSAGRAARLGFFTALRQELAHRKTGVSVTSVALGYLHTESGGNALGKHNPYFNNYWTTALWDGAENCIIYTELRKQEITYPFIAQVHAGLYHLFPNFYQRYSDYIIPRMPKVAKV